MSATEQKLRKELQAAIVLFGHKCHDDCTKLTWLERAEQALALPTAEQVDDINVAESFTSVTKTAAPVGERELFERWAKDNAIRTDLGAWAAWQARAALRAGDAVDAQMYRWLMDNCTLGIKQNGVGWSLNTTACIAPDCIKDVGATIDAAMRKGQL